MAYKSFTKFLNQSAPQPRKLNVVDATLFTGSISQLTTVPPDGRKFAEYSPENIDLFRYRGGKYWSLNTERNIKYADQRQQFNLSFGSPTDTTETNIWGISTKDKITIKLTDTTLLETAGSQEQSVINKWINYVDARYTTDSTNGIVPMFSKLLEANGNGAPIDFYDHAFNLEIPLDRKILENSFAGTIRNVEAEIKPVYNYYVQSYETAMEKYEIPEVLLPNFYAFLTVLTSNEPGITDNVNDRGFNPTIDTTIEKQITLAGAIPDTLVAIEKEVLNTKGERVKSSSNKVSKGQYFEKYAHNYNRSVVDSTRREFELNRLSREFSNQIAPMSNLNLFTDYNDMARQFPMYVDLSFSTDITTNVADILKKTNLSSILIKDVIASRIPGFAPEEVDMNLVSSNGMPFNPTPGADSSKLKCWDVGSWFNFISNNPVESFRTFGEALPLVFLGPYNEEMKLASAYGSDATIYDFFKNLMVLAFGGKLTDLVKEKIRTFEEILNGKEAYNETVFYKIEKHSTIENENGNLIPDQLLQTTYLPNSSDIDVHRFIDTQIKYGKKYIYRIYSYEMVIGTKYYYSIDSIPNHDGSQTPTRDVANDEARVCSINEPSVKLIEVPYFQKSVVMMDKPPVHPEVNVVPYRDVKDKLLFLFQGNTGDYKLKPIFLQDTDEQKMNDIRLSQDLTSDELVRFSNDDPPQRFEVFRTTKKPTKYEDFIGKKIADIKTDQFNIPCKIASAGAFRETIDPNIKHYYTFRTIDNHGNFSNPSPVYEIEIVYDAGSPFLSLNIIDMSPEKNPPQMASKKVRKYIEIKPSQQQITFNKVASGVEDQDGNKIVNNLITDTNLDEEGGNVHLGTSGQNLWGKTLKVRIISRKTGKRVDVNIKFTHKPEIIRGQTDNKLC
jgi:hypothetical protein